jgi:hypothetical protein
MADPKSNSIRAVNPTFTQGPTVREGILPSMDGRQRMGLVIEMRDRDERTYLIKLSLALGIPVSGFEVRSIQEIRSLLITHAGTLLALGRDGVKVDDLVPTEAEVKEEVRDEKPRERRNRR